MGVLGRPRLRACSVLSSANLLPGLGVPDKVWATGTAGLPDLLLHDTLHFHVLAFVLCFQIPCLLPFTAGTADGSGWLDICSVEDQ